MRRSIGVLCFGVMLCALASCAGDDGDEIVAASPTAISIVTFRFVEPATIAEAHCAKHGRKAVSQGGVRLGVGYKIMWGFDCIK